MQGILKFWLIKKENKKIVPLKKFNLEPFSHHKRQLTGIINAKQREKSYFFSFVCNVEFPVKLSKNHNTQIILAPACFQFSYVDHDHYIWI